MSILQLTGDTGTAGGLLVNLLGTANQIVSTGDNASTVTLSIPSTPTLAGTVKATTYFSIPDCSTSAIGYFIGGNRILHNTGAAYDATGNIFLGLNTGANAGNCQYCTVVGVNSAATLGSNGAANYNTIAGSNSFNGATYTGTKNTSVGYNCGNALTSGSYNTFMGNEVANNLTTGSYNTAIGNTYDSGAFAASGSAWTSSESSNIIIGNVGVVGESNTIHIGTQGTGTGRQSACSIAGITGATVTGAAVLCSTTGLLGTVASSIRFKENVEDMGSVSNYIFNLRPVTFTYKKHPEMGQQVGLIAEEVNESMPNLVLIGLDGLPETVKYHELPVLLLNELQKLIKRTEMLEAIK
jgi:hypothetical protein